MDIGDDRKPNLFLIGAAKSGTTSLHHYLASHDAIFMSDPKEPGYFVPEMDYYPKDLEWYLGLFADAGEAEIRGESSTHYTKRPMYEGVAERIDGFAPDARFVYLMRDPVKRAISHYWHNVRQYAEHRPILEALRENVEYTAISDYEMQLRPYFERFGRDRVRTLTFEELVGDTKAVVDDLFRWLGVEPGLDPELVDRRWNERPDEVEKIRGRGLVYGFRNSALWNRLSPAIPQPLKDAAKVFSVESLRPEDVSAEEAVEYLRTTLEEPVARLREILGRDFSEWRTLAMR